MSGIEHAIFALADAIRRIADVRKDCVLKGCDEGVQVSKVKEEILTRHLHDLTAECMDDAGVPTLFKLRCSACGELGRNLRTHQDEMQDGTYHWVMTK